MYHCVGLFSFLVLGEPILCGDVHSAQGTSLWLGFLIIYFSPHSLFPLPKMFSGWILYLKMGSMDISLEIARNVDSQTSPQDLLNQNLYFDEIPGQHGCTLHLEICCFNTLLLHIWFKWLGTDFWRTVTYHISPQDHPLIFPGLEVKCPSSLRWETF